LIGGYLSRINLTNQYGDIVHPSVFLTKKPLLVLEVAFFVFKLLIVKVL
jgi:hypothetical protein